MAVVKLFILCLIAATILAKPPKTNKKTVTFDIPGGESNGPSSYPYLVSLRSNIYTGMTHECSGAIISEYFVLMTASCIKKDAPVSKYAIAVGARNQYDGEILKIKTIYVHEEFVSWNLQNDIALIELTERIFFSRHVQPIEMDRNFVRAGFDAVFSVFGNKQMLDIYLTIITENECKSAYGMRRTYIHENKTLCAVIDEPDTSKRFCFLFHFHR